MANRKNNRLVLENFGPIRHADVQFGDLTVVVGPQATGKSIFLQTLKLVQDRAHIHDIFSHFSMVFDENSAAFLGGYFGKGMADAWKEGESALRWNGRGHSLLELARPGKAKDRREHVFLIPAQRVMSLASGVPMAGVLFPAATLGVVLLPIMIFHQIQLMACAVIANAYAKRADTPQESR